MTLLAIWTQRKRGPDVVALLSRKGAEGRPPEIGPGGLAESLDSLGSAPSYGTWKTGQGWETIAT